MFVRTWPGAKFFFLILIELLHVCLVLAEFLIVMDHFIEMTVNAYRSELINLLLDPSLFNNVHLLVQKLLEMQDAFDAYVSQLEESDYDRGMINSTPRGSTPPRRS